MNNKIKKYITFFLDVFGYKIIKKSNKHKRGAIKKAIKKFKNKEIIACEIGVFRGCHAVQILKNLNVKKIYLIDSYKSYNNYNDYKIGNEDYYDLKKAKEEAHSSLKKYNNKTVWIEKFSNDAVKSITEKIDFIYIDGNHSSPYINDDIKNYYHFLTEGGIISGHDYNENNPDVMRAVFEFSKQINRPIIFGDGDDWAFVK